MRIDTTSDSPSWTKVFDIGHELRQLGPLMEEKYPDLDWELFVCLRCLPKDLQRKLIGIAFFTFFAASIRKYEKKLPGLQPVSAQLIADVRQWCIDNQWTDSAV
ncbi:hypothetical protein O3297_26650 [Janthinobacterium sp. SUN128]|uniref:hypothetical protein n=1 Tax=Janthinobacterium sp. SUN128 TaxID=3014790 RepID=UPI002712E5C3|nr:hypothetical protein [Janthinobacterium sp. SUN128]MDO8037011.1 hypothetical protein [Janthinobacterium sp. SUN128]